MIDEKINVNEFINNFADETLRMIMTLINLKLISEGYGAYISSSNEITVEK